MRDKLAYTKQLVDQLPDQHKVSVDTARSTWWFNIRPKGGMRLTAAGFKVLSEQLDLKFYPYKIPDEMLFTQQTILDLDRKLQNPYYIVTKKSFPIDVVFFGSKEAMLVNLYGDLAKFLDNYTE
jgi:hypothetical protein